MSTPPKEAQKNTCPSNQENEDDSQSAASLHFDLLTLQDRKASFDSDLHSFRESECCHAEGCVGRGRARKGKAIHKKEREGDSERRAYLSKQKRISQLENKVEELQREIASLRRNEYYCLCCKSRLPEYYRQRLDPPIRPEEPVLNVAGDVESKKDSKDSLQFEKFNFHAPLFQSQQMQQKLWIFVGTMLIAMGSKVTDFDGTINIFKVLKQSVDHVRRQVEKCEPKIGLQFFCCKEELNQPHQNYIDGMIFDPFFSQKHEAGQGHFSLDGIKLQSVEEYQLFYDSKYHFHIKYDALLTIIEFARDNCSIS